MKQRLSALDIAALVVELKEKLEGLRLGNIYDVNPKTFVFKFQKPDLKEMLLIESGTRIHSTAYVRDKQPNPSGFCAKLRKYLKTRRLTTLYQIGLDRRIVLQFGEGDFAYHLIIEFFATGNIILTDKDFKILALLRIVQLEHQSIAVGEVYEMPQDSVHQPMSRELLLHSFQSYFTKQEGPVEPVDTDQLKGFNKKKSKKKKALNLKGALRTIMGPKYGSSLVDQALYISKLDQNMDDFGGIMSQGKEFEQLFDAFVECDKIVEQCAQATQKGFIIADQVSGGNEEEKQLMFDDFLPFEPLFVKTGSVLKSFETFDKAVDEFFSKIESQRLQQKARQAELQALKKLETVKQNNANQIKNFQISQEQKNLMAQAIEYNLDLVDSAIKTICSFVASGMDWGDLKELVKEEQENGNPLARAIHGLKLEEGMITLQLPDPSIEIESSDSEIDETDSDVSREEEIGKKPNKSAKPLLIDVDIYQSAYANARSYYDAKKVAVMKEQKTIQASVKALESAEKKIMQTLQKKESQVASITKYRTPYWFEKFLWFISTENYLVVGGRDSTQSEQLVMKYMHPGDLFVSADMDGSASVIVKPLPGNPSIIPHMTLQQAGTMSVCHSRAWEAKIVTSAFWVRHDQLTKVSAAGDSLPVGVFNIKGKKKYLPPVQLVYGVGLLFQVDEESVQAHELERKPWKRDGYVPELDTRAVDMIETENHGNEDLVSELTTMNLQENSSQSELVAPEPVESCDTAQVEGVVEDPDDGPEMPQENQDSDDSKEASLEKAANKKRLSAKQRREMKKKNLTTTDAALGSSSTQMERIESSQSVQTESRQSATSNDAVPTKNAPLPRGKKAKLKKMQTKYADQDDEDRALMLELLGSNKGPQPKGKRAKEKALKEQEKLTQLQQKQQKAQPQKHPKVQAKSQPPAPIPAVAFADVEIPETNLEDLTGQTTASDTVLSCIPVCAPWISLQKYKYKLKLLPGSLKKGKAAQQASFTFLTMAKKQFKSESEENLIKAIADQEWINMMMGKVKIVTSK